MCCLFGMVDYGRSFTGKQKTKILHALASASEARGTDAAGIAYNSNGRLHVYKRPLPGHRLPLHIPDDTAVVMGHTRLATQGDGIRNYNNHPFQARAGKTAFALAHNGVLRNDRKLRQLLNLPKTNIETDSFVAVQLLQQKETLNFDSLKYMAEKVEGSFTFTLLDERDNLYFVKGDNPMRIYQYPRLGLYVYASTEEILRDALGHIPCKLGRPKRVPLGCGELLEISPDGTQRRSAFCFSDPFALRSWNRFPWSCFERVENDYIRSLKSVAGAYGITPDQIDCLLDEGYTGEEIEDYLYCGGI